MNSLIFMFSQATQLVQIGTCVHVHVHVQIHVYSCKTVHVYVYYALLTENVTTNSSLLLMIISKLPIITNDLCFIFQLRSEHEKLVQSLKEKSGELEHECESLKLKMETQNSDHERQLQEVNSSKFSIGGVPHIAGAILELSLRVGIIPLNIAL